VKQLRVGFAVVILVVLAAGTTWAEVYVEGYLGSAFSVTAPNPIGLHVNPAYRGPISADPEFPRTLSTGVIPGFKIGTWFVKEGFLGFNYPDWMKYFGCYFDFSYNRLVYLRGIGSRRMNITPSNYPYYTTYKFWGDGNIITLAFMFAFRYGFFPREKVPFGKLQPYAAVGPAILIMGLTPTFMQQPNNNYELFFVALNPREFQSSFKSTATVALAAEIGVRYMITRFLSLDTSFKYRYARPTINYDLSVDGFSHTLRFAPELNLFSLQAGLAYHF
jgi:hypothetical protein